jgi:hypothetical protein
LKLNLAAMMNSGQRGIEKKKEKEEVGKNGLAGW